MVRETRQIPRTYLLSVKYNDIQLEVASVKHYKILTTNEERYYIDVVFGSFSTLEDLIEHYMTFSSGLCCRLTYSLKRNNY